MRARVSRSARTKLLLGLLLALLGPGIPKASAQQVTVFAAASLRDAMEEISRRYREAAGKAPSVSYAGSSALARQIESGAPADVFISADLDWMDYVEKKSLLKPGSRTNLVRNELVLIAPAASTVKATVQPGFPLAQLLGSDRLAMADPDAVPAGKYGRAALEALGVWSSVARKIARAENVRAALRFVARGEAPLGIVYRTDAAADKDVRIVSPFPANTHPPIVYPMSLVTTGRSPHAQRFYDFVKSRAASDIFRKHGFMPY